jgi:hypothetical protein
MTMFNANGMQVESDLPPNEIPVIDLPEVDPEMVKAELAEIAAYEEQLRKEQSQKAVVLLSGLVEQSLSVRRYRHGRLDQNLRWYVGDHWDVTPPDGLSLFTINKIQNAVLSATNLQIEQPIRPRFEPSNTGVSSEFVLTEEAANRLAPYALMIGLPPEVLSGEQVLTEQEVLALMQIPQTDEFGNPMVDPMTMAPMTVVHPTDFFEVSDRICNDELQSVFDFKWEEAEADTVVNENVLDNNVIGFQPMWFRRENEGYRWCLSNPHPKRVYPDPANSDPKKFTYVIFDDLVWADKAKSKNPEWSEVIDKNKESGVVLPKGFFEQDWGYADTITYHQEMVVIRYGYLRFQAYPMTEDEALQCGKVMVGENGEYVDETGAMTAPDAPNWPIKRDCVREIVQIGDEVVRDERCMESDVPMLWNICKPVPKTPWGQGMPEIMEDVQRAINMLASIFKNHAGYYQAPMEMMPESVYQLVKDNEGALGSFPGRRLRVPDALLSEFGVNAGGMFVNPPPLPASLVQFFEYLMGLIEELGGRPETSRGISDPNASSGRAIEALQSAAKGLFSFLAKNTENMVRQLGLLMLYSIQDGWMPENEWGRVLNGKYPPRILRAIRNRVKRMRFDVNVEITAASGNFRRIEAEQARADYASGLASLETTLEKIGSSDPQAEMEKIRMQNVANMSQSGSINGMNAGAVVPPQ